MQRMTIYLTEELHAAICAHADAAGQKLSTFVGRELAHLVDETADSAAPLRRQAEKALRHAELSLAKQKAGLTP